MYIVDEGPHQNLERVTDTGFKNDLSAEFFSQHALNVMSSKSSFFINVQVIDSYFS